MPAKSLSAVFFFFFCPPCKHTPLLERQEIRSSHATANGDGQRYLPGRPLYYTVPALAAAYAVFRCHRRCCLTAAAPHRTAVVLRGDRGAARRRRRVAVGRAERAGRRVHGAAAAAACAPRRRGRCPSTNRNAGDTPPPNPVRRPR